MTEQASKPPRTWRPMALWSVAIVAALGLVWLAGAIAVPVRQVRTIIDEWHSGSYHALYSEEFFSADVGRLGGPKEATRKISLYLRFPERLAPHKEFAVAILGECGQPAVPELHKLLRHQTASIRSAAASALKKIRGEEPKP